MRGLIRPHSTVVSLVPTKKLILLFLSSVFMIYRVLLLYLPRYHRNAYSNLITFHILILSNLVNNRHSLLLFQRAAQKSCEFYTTQGQKFKQDETKAPNTEECSVRNWLNETNTKCFQTACCSYTKSNKPRVFHDFFSVLQFHTCFKQYHMTAANSRLL